MSRPDIDGEMFTTAVQMAADTQARLNNVLDMLIRAEEQNSRLSTELSQAHREIAQLISERDTWRAQASQ